MGQLAINILWISLISSLFIIGVWLLSPLLNRRYVAKLKYWVWLVIAVRLMLPIHFALPQAPMTITVPEAPVVEMFAPITTPIQGDIVELPGATDPAPAEHPVETAKVGINIYQLLFLVWAVGCVSFVILQLLRYFITKRHLLRWSIDAQSIEIRERIADLSKDLSIKKNILPMINGEASGPMIVGLLRPILLLPHEDYNSTDLDYILRHELVHYQRRDIVYKIVLFFANAVHWFNPAVYLMVREANADLEMACDDEVTKGCPHEERKAYSEVILASISHNKLKGYTFTTCFNSGTKKMKVRFENIMNTNPKRNGFIMATVIVLMVCIVGSFTAFAYPTAASSTNSNQPTAPNAPYFDSYSSDNTARIGGRGYVGNWSASDTVTGGAYTEQLDNKIAYIEQLYQSRQERYIIEDGISFEEIQNTEGVQYMFSSSEIYRDLVTVDDVLHVQPRSTFSKSSDDSVLYNRYVFNLEAPATLRLSVFYDLNVGNMAVLIISPEGEILHEISANSNYNQTIELNLESGLHSVVLAHELDNGRIRGDIAVQGQFQ